MKERADNTEDPSRGNNVKKGTEVTGSENSLAKR